MPLRKPAPRPVRIPATMAPETVDAKWLLNAFALVIAVAALLGYGTLCLLFYHGQWQLVLHPGKHLSVAPPFQAQIVRFSPDATATPQLTGWWIPAPAGTPYSRITLLYLRGADGVLSDDVSALALLHDAGLNLLAFNYRGYPATIKERPSQKHMTEDAEAAWQYLLTDRHLAPDSIVPYGVGVGAALAVQLAGQHLEIPALILDTPRGDLLHTVLRAPEGYFLPVRLLFNQRFPLAEPLGKLATPKLIISRDPDETAIRQQASDPKTTVELPPGSSPAVLGSTLRRFLDQYLPAAALSKHLKRQPRPDSSPSKPLE